MRFRNKLTTAKLPALFKALTLPFCTALTFLAGCTTDSEIVLPIVPQKLVVSSFISPEAARVEVSVSRSASLTSPENNGQYKPVTNATVWLSDGQDSVLVLYNDSTLYVTKALPILPGKSYSLRVTTPEGFAAQASCTVPAEVNTFLTARIDSTITGPQTAEGNYALELRWPDLPGEGHFYRVEGITQTRESAAPAPVMIRHTALAFLDEPQVKDAAVDGRTWQLTTEVISEYRQNQRNGNLKNVQAFLYTTDQAYFEYHRSLYRYQMSDGFSDPIKIYSNVKGGLGIFGAYRRFTVDVPIR